ncbi:TolC family outer membrane protein [Methylobacillus gramineus]|uniref:TolC family outer membrane protein n=1 Tax=Methylobacillus gramineus TaxID=755169 RepID=UPI001CFFB19E|nr:TolC family outer membrane protein [Methylobacillus gramineus]MCB5183838.1 TolC family outer membrane protein [Methylobacillus gramineus]
MTHRLHNADLKTTLLSLVIALPLMFTSQASVAAENLLSLYQKALQYDAQYKAAEAITEAEREEINKSRALFLPRVQFGANVGHGTTDRTTQTSLGSTDTRLNYDIHSYTLSLRQTLFNKESMATYRGAEASIKSKEALLLKENATLITRLASAYFETLYAQEKVDVLQNKIDATTQQRDQAQRRYEHGEGTITEINEAQAALELAQAELISTQNSLEVFKQNLSTISGEQVDRIAPLNTNQLPLNIPDSESLDYWLEQALGNNPEITAARLSVEAARQEVEKKRAGHYPTLDLVGIRSYSENDSNNTLGSRFDTTTVALQLNMPLFAGGYTNASVRQANSRVDAAEELLNLRTRDTEANTRKYVNSIRSGLLALSAYRQAVKSSEIAVEGTQKGFAAGTRTNIEVLNAQQKLYSSRLELSRVQYVLVNDIINLKQAAGVLNEAQLHALNQYFAVN